MTQTTKVKNKVDTFIDIGENLKLYCSCIEKVDFKSITET